MNTITIPSIDPTTFCRVCFADINLLIVIQPNSADEPANQDLLQLVKTYLRLEFGGAKDFPCAVCELCYRLLREFDLLYTNAQHNNEALKVLIESKQYLQSTPAQLDEEALDTQETTLVEIIEPSTATEDESIGEKDMLRLDSVAGDNFLDGQIILEELPYTETGDEEQQVHVFHLDGELQQVVISGNRHDTNVPRNGTKSPATLQPRVVKKPIATPAGRPLLKLTPVPRPSHKVLVQSINSLKSEQNTSQLMRQKHQKSPSMATSSNLNKKLYRCDNCPNLFLEQSKYHDHDCVKQHPSSSQAGKTTPYWCTECNVGYRRELYWEKHLYEVHGICSENFGITCSICQLLFSQKQDYQLHVLAMH
uniref:ZAD domain-containing protein n=1 Tax=Anopheles atroparvus TaxID=41427 RepID=A0AAG5CWZ5_ANOAO